jgi:Domain of unknown function (DUF4136)
MSKNMLLALMAFGAAAGCASSIPPVQVTRFHSTPQLSAGAALIEPLSGDPQSLEFRTYAAAVARELGKLGVTDSRDSTTPYMVTVDVARETREGVSRGSPVTIGIGTANIGRNGGVGLGGSFGLGRNRANQVVVTRMAVQIRKRSDKSVIWEGRAQTEAPARAPSAQPGLAADKLAAALFRDFPGISGQTVTVQ